MAYIYEFDEYRERTRTDSDTTMRVYQILPSVCRGDKISNDALEIYKELSDHRIKTHIYADHIGLGISSRRVSHIDSLPILKKEDVIIYHMSTETGMYGHIREIKTKYGCNIIVRYHNITPPEYFEDYNKDIAERCRQGLEEAKKISDIPTEVLAVSDYDRKQLRDMGYTCPIMILPPLVPLAEYNIDPSEEVMGDYPLNEYINLLYVGQLAPHKRIERLMDIYDSYYRMKNDKVRLFLVGSTMEVPEYYQYLEDYRKKLGYRENQIIMTGHVQFNEMIAYYKIADVMISMSEAEGFGMSLVEAMYYDVPVLAYEAGAVPETLGGSGLLLPTCQPDNIAEVIDTVIRNPLTRGQILVGQQRRIQSLIDSKPRKELIKVIESMQR